jgi:hypothetical protein
VESDIGPTEKMTKLVLGVESVRRHVTDEAHVLQLGLKEAGWTLCGHKLDVDEVSVPKLLAQFNPTVVILVDRREWDIRPNSQPTPGNWRDPAARFTDWQVLKERPDILRLSVIKDNQNPAWHQQLDNDAGLDGWISYYHQDAVLARAPWITHDRLIRTWHSVDSQLVPPFSADRKGCLLSGFVGKSCARIYPLRIELFKRYQELPETDILEHPGYGEVGCRSTEFLNTLSKDKVAICTASTRDFLLRKVVEASACGCAVVTNLSDRDRPVGIENNLIRVSPNAWFDEVARAVRIALDNWDVEKQFNIVEKVKREYDWRIQGQRLSWAIDEFGRRMKS